MIPGSNILAMALSVIGSSPVRWLQYASEITDAQGLVVKTYAAPQMQPKGSVQAVNRSRYEAYGLDFEKNYITWFVSDDVKDLSALPLVTPGNLSYTSNGDLIEWPVNRDGTTIIGKTHRYQLIGSTDWYSIDGWKEMLAVDLGIAPQV